MAWNPSHRVAFSLNGHERFEDLAVEDAFGRFGGFVGHEAVDEGEGCLGDEDAGEGEVWWCGVSMDEE